MYLCILSAWKDPLNIIEDLQPLFQLRLLLSPPRFQSCTFFLFRHDPMQGKVLLMSSSEFEPALKVPEHDLGGFCPIVRPRTQMRVSLVPSSRLPCLVPVSRPYTRIRPSIRPSAVDEAASTSGRPADTPRPRPNDPFIAAALRVKVHDDLRTSLRSELRLPLSTRLMPWRTVSGTLEDLLCLIDGSMGLLHV